MHEDDQVVFTVAGDIRDQGFAGFGKITPAAAEGAFFKHRPAVGGHQFPAGIEHNEVQITPAGFQKNQILATIVVQIARNHVV